MTRSSKIDEVMWAVGLITQPLLLEALAAISEGRALEDALPADVDVEVLSAALRRLASIGVVELSPVAPFGYHTLTVRGRQFVLLLEDLHASIVSGEGSSCDSPGMTHRAERGAVSSVARPRPHGPRPTHPSRNRP